MTLFKGIVENIVVVIATLAILLAGVYLLLIFFDRLLKLKTGRREQEGLTAMLLDSMKHHNGLQDVLEDKDGSSGDEPDTRQ